MIENLILRLLRRRATPQIREGVRKKRDPDDRSRSAHVCTF